VPATIYFSGSKCVRRIPPIESAELADTILRLLESRRRLFG